MSDAIVVADPAEPRGITPTSFDAVWAMAERLAGARGFIPQHLEGNPGSIAACILTGLELGLGPMQSLRSIYVIDGRPMLSADLMLSIALRGGVKVTWETTTTTEARVHLERAGHGAHRQTFCEADAKRAGLLGKSNWKKYPAAMLRARCISAALRAFCPDVIGAGVYVEGEIEATEAIDVTPKPAATESPELARSRAAGKAQRAFVREVKAGRMDGERLDSAVAHFASLGVDEDTVREWHAASGQCDPEAVFPPEDTDEERIARETAAIAKACDQVDGVEAARLEREATATVEKTKDLGPLLVLADCTSRKELLGAIERHRVALRALDPRIMGTALAEHAERLDVDVTEIDAALGPA